MSFTAADIPSSQLSSLSSSEDVEDDDDIVVTVSSLEAGGARGEALREISIYKPLDDDRWTAGGHWSLPPLPLARGGNLSHHYAGGVRDNWASRADRPPTPESRKNDADDLFRGLRTRRRIHRGHRGAHHHRGNGRRKTAAADSARRRTGRHVDEKRSFSDVWDGMAAEIETTSCAELQCSGSARCVVDERTGRARCRCPLGTAGTYCEQGPFFSESTDRPIRGLITHKPIGGLQHGLD